MLCGVSASMIGALVHAGVSAVFIAPGSMLVGMLVSVGFWALIAPIGLFVGGSVRTTSKSAGRFVFAVVLATSIFGLWLLWLGQVYSYYLDMKEDEVYYQGELKQPSMPRFWFHGNFPRRDSP